MMRQALSRISKKYILEISFRISHHNSFCLYLKFVASYREPEKVIKCVCDNMERGREMSAENSEQYRDYMRHRTNLNSVLTLFSGFSFTAITILITRLQNPSTLEAQFMLFFLMFMLDFFLFLLGYNTAQLIYLCKYVPPLTTGTRVFNTLFYFGFILFEFAVVAMFLIWNLTFLALTAMVMNILFLIASYLLIWKPFQKRRK